METAPILPLPTGTEGADKPPGISARPRRHSWLNTLAVISRRITVAPTAIDAYRDMVDLLAGALDFECITYYEPAPGGEVLNLVHAAGNNRELLASCTPWPVGRGVLGLAYRSGSTVLVNDISNSPIYVAALPGTNAELAVPLVDDDEVVGVLDIEARHRGYFSATAVEVVEAIAAQAVVVRRVARLRRREKQQLHEQRAVHMAALDILAARPWEETLRYVTRQLRQLSGATAAGLYLVEPDRRELVLAMADGLPASATGSRMPMGAGIAGLVAVNGRAEVTRDYSTWEGRAPTYNGNRWHAAAGTPLIHGGDVIGVITLLTDDPDRVFGDDEVRALELLAAPAALAVSNARLAEKLDELARRDPLTLSANRRAWEEELPKYVARAGREFSALSVAMFDLDHFKDFNDVQGHQRGDLLLREVTEAWRTELREGDLLARYGGEEFALILAGCRLEEAVQIVERLRQSTPAGQTCSAGVACWDTHESAEALVARADAALYGAKLNGRNRTVAAMPEMGRAEPQAHTGATLAGWTRWTGVVPRLLEERSLRSAYQPVVRLENGAIVGYEALARPLGMGPEVSVDGLFAAAQYRGLGRDLDWLCRRTALTCAVDMPLGASLFVNVGVSALLDPLHDVDQMLLLLEHAGRRPEDVVLEITEREAVRDMARFSEVLALYRESGFRFAIDDVGEGHSTLEVLATASPEFIKLARSLMISAGRPGPRSAIHAVVAFARSAGAEVIAEGIETASEADNIRALGVELGQGTHLGRPQLAPQAFGTARAAG
jgi:diguanylate cyclase (GGDEF)-like protein